MKSQDGKQINFAWVLCFSAICIAKIRGCSVLERTQDMCRSSGRIWLGGSIHRSIYKGGSTNTFTISAHMRQLYWFCGNSKERVAWNGKANRLRVNFLSYGRVKWEFLLCPPQVPQGCRTRKPPQTTTDRCRHGGHLWLEGGINKSVPKGTSTGSLEISRHMRELRWFCGYRSSERVAWSGGANILVAHFERNGIITWQFFTCEPPPECSNTRHPLSLRINLEKVTLTSRPTDNVFLGWESLFGKPADEIVANLESKRCYARSKVREIKQGMTLYYYNSLFLKSFRAEPIKFWLSEEDGGLEGKNDLSQLITIPRRKMDAIRNYLNDDRNGWFELDYLVTVKGQNIFQEHKWFGFIAGNLCINVLDFVTGPWTGPGFTLLRKVSRKTIGRFRSGQITQLYKTIKRPYAIGSRFNKKQLKQKFFKAVMTYQFREGLKSLVKGAGRRAKKNMQDEVKAWVLNETGINEMKREIRMLIEEAVKEGIYAVGGRTLLEKTLKIYNTVTKQLDKFGAWFQKITDAFEFCLSDILPPARDAAYHVYFTVNKS